MTKKRFITISCSFLLLLSVVAVATLSLQKPSKAHAAGEGTSSITGPGVSFTDTEYPSCFGIGPDTTCIVNQEFVYDLDRIPDSASAANYATALDSGTLSYDAFYREVAFSQEATNDFSALYQGCLGRPISASELAFRQTALYNHTRDLFGQAIDILQSSEAQSHGSLCKLQFSGYGV
jgi:hypothetical protein